LCDWEIIRGRRGEGHKETRKEGDKKITPHSPLLTPHYSLLVTNTFYKPYLAMLLAKQECRCLLYLLQKDLILLNARLLNARLPIDRLTPNPNLGAYATAVNNS